VKTEPLSDEELRNIDRRLANKDDDISPLTERMRLLDEVERLRNELAKPPRIPQNVIEQIQCQGALIAMHLETIEQQQQELENYRFLYRDEKMREGLLAVGTELMELREANKELRRQLVAVRHYGVHDGFGFSKDCLICTSAGG